MGNGGQISSALLKTKISSREPRKDSMQGSGMIRKALGDTVIAVVQ